MTENQSLIPRITYCTIKNWLIVLISISLTVSCTSYKAGTETKQNLMKKEKSNNDKFIVSGPIISKEHVLKNSQGSGEYEYYFRMSMGDFFIKFCESSISKEKFENYLNTAKLSDIMGDKVVILEIELISNGMLDNCDQKNLDIQLQSRMGDYVIIKKIVK